ncbi:MAG: dTMP kinase [Verrucomicrobia bacterium]|nr:dTMP kinase [Verrucomicrobiota bacterium]
MTSAGRFLTFEGCEGCGKSTQITSTLAWLRSAKLTVHEVREPGGTPVGEVIRHLLKHDPVGQSMTAETELLLFAASRAELVRQLIHPALARGDWIIADRFHDSTTVFQGNARGLPMEEVSFINRYAIAQREPDLTLVLDLDPAEARSRALRRPRPAGQKDRLEDLDLGFYQKVAEGYRALAQREPKRIKLIDASGSREQTFAMIQKELRHAFSSLPR